MKQPRTPMVVSEINGKDELLLEIKASAIHPLIFFSDGLTIIRFNKEKKAYMLAQQCLDWHRKELADRGGVDTKKKIHGNMIAALEKLLQRFQTGDMTVVPEKIKS